MARFVRAATPVIAFYLVPDERSDGFLIGCVALACAPLLGYLAGWR